MLLIGIRYTPHTSMQSANVCQPGFKISGSNFNIEHILSGGESIQNVFVINHC